MSEPTAAEALRRIDRHEEQCDLRYQRLEQLLEKMESRHYQIIWTMATGAVGIIVAILLQPHL